MVCRIARHPDPGPFHHSHPRESVAQPPQPRAHCHHSRHCFVGNTNSVYASSPSSRLCTLTPHVFYFPGRGHTHVLIFGRDRKIPPYARKLLKRPGFGIAGGACWCLMHEKKNGPPTKPPPLQKYHASAP